MNAIFKCENCNKAFERSIDNFGLMVNKCPYCGDVYVICQNLKESIDYCNKLDIIRGNKNEKSSNSKTT